MSAVQRKWLGNMSWEAVWEQAKQAARESHNVHEAANKISVLRGGLPTQWSSFAREYRRRRKLGLEPKNSSANELIGQASHSPVQVSELVQALEKELALARATLDEIAALASERCQFDIMQLAENGRYD